MALKKGDLIDEHKRFPDSCGLIMKVMSGGEGFEKIVCCGHELTDADVVHEVGSSKGRSRGTLQVGTILDERKMFPQSCGLRMMVVDGGAGFQEIVCCGHSITSTSSRELRFDQMRRTPMPDESGPHGNA